MTIENSTIHKVKVFGRYKKPTLIEHEKEILKKKEGWKLIDIDNFIYAYYFISVLVVAS